MDKGSKKKMTLQKGKPSRRTSKGGDGGENAGEGLPSKATLPGEMENGEAMKKDTSAWMTLSSMQDEGGN